MIPDVYNLGGSVSKMGKVSKSDERGRITIPREVREKVGLEREQRLRIIVQGEELILVPMESEPEESLEEFVGEVKFDREARRRAEKWQVTRGMPLKLLS